MAISDMPWALPAKQPIHTAQEMKEAAAQLVEFKAYPFAGTLAALIRALPVEPTDDGVLPCDVLVAPATVLRKGTKVSTLMTCLAMREGMDVRRIENHPLIPTDDGAFDIVAHLERQRAFSLKTFGPGARTLGVTDHISKELDEIRADPSDLKEWVDVIILAFDGAWRAGWEPAEIVKAIAAKQAKNEARTWPDWRTADPNKAIEHDRTKEAAPTDDARKLALAKEALEKAACDFGIECMAEDQPMSKCPHYACQCALAAIEGA